MRYHRAMWLLPWRDLRPDHALPAGDPSYVPRVDGGDRLATLVRAGLAPIVVTGPFGSGKTTELNRAIDRLTPDIVALHVSIHELADLDVLTPELLLYRVGELLLDKLVAMRPEVRPSKAVIADLLASDPRLSRGKGHERTPLDCARIGIEEATRGFGAGRIALFFDDADEAPEAQARMIVRELLRVADFAHVVVVAPAAITNGPVNHDIIGRARVFLVSGLPVIEDAGTGWEAGRRLLGDIVRRRLGPECPPALDDLLWRAAELSGGSPRLFLQLVLDAARYGLADGKALPDPASLAEAAKDGADGLRRQVLAGDLDALAEADGTNGLEVEPDRRVRFLHTGLLVEQRSGDAMVVRYPRLLQGVIDTRPGKPRRRRKKA